MKTVLIGMLIVLGVATLAFGQVINARLGGTVLDPSGAEVPRAQVRLVNNATGVAYAQSTDSRGHYVFVNLPPGRYRITATASGFKKLVETLSPLHVGDQVELNLTLQVGAMRQVVTVRGTPPVLETQSPAIDFVATSKEILTMPLNGRDFTQLATLLPGAAITGSGRAGINGLTLSGSRTEENNFTLDGVGDVDPNFATVALKPSLDSIREFRVVTNGYSAEYGRYAGGQIDVITKAGTNQLHGSLYEFLRNNALDARNFFSGPGPTPALRRNDFGGTIGGPITIPKVYNGKNRTFFFFDYEGVRQEKASSNVSHVPTTLERNGNFSQTFLPNGKLNVIYDPTSAPVDANGYYLSPRLPFPGNIIPANRIPSAMALVTSLLPAANLPGTGLNYVNNSPGTANTDQYSGQIDQNFGSRLRLMGRYTSFNNPSIVPGYMSGRYSTNANSGRNLVLNLNWVVSPNVINEARFGATRNVSNSLGGSTQGASLVSKFWPANILSIGLPLINSDPGLPNFIILGNGGLWYNNGAPGDGRGTSSFKDNVFQGIDNLTVIHGKHIFKFGTDDEHTQFRTVNFQTLRGSIGFQGLYTMPAGPNGITNYSGGNGFADFLLGSPTDDTRGFSDAPLYTRWNTYALYGEDQWRVTKRLTADAGLRWEYPAPISVLPVRTGYNFTSNAAGHLIYETVPNLVSIVPDLQNHTYSYMGGTPWQTSVWIPDRHSFAPRIGLAYLLTPKTVVRSAFGVFFGQGPADILAEEEANGPFAINEDVVTAYWSSPLAPSVCIQVCGEKQSTIPDNPWANGFGFAPKASIINPFTPTFSVNPFFHLGYAEQYNLSVQRQLGAGLGLQVAYVGSHSLKLPRTSVTNVGYLLNGKGIPAPIPSAGPMWRFMWDSLAYYNSLQVQLEQKPRAGLYYIASFTWSKSEDTASSAHDVSDNLIGLSQIYPNALLARSPYDVQKMFHFSLYYTPSLDQHLLKGAPRAVKDVVSNWTMGDIVDLEGGNPQYPGSSGVSVGPSQPCGLPSGQRTPLHWFNTNCVVATNPEESNHIPRDFIIGPGYYDWDTSVIREFPIKEGKNLEFRFEAFNVLNHPNFLGVNTFLGTGSFGSVMGARDGRDIEVALKFSF